jgi:hypothetical protein
MGTRVFTPVFTRVFTRVSQYTEVYRGSNPLLQDKIYELHSQHPSKNKRNSLQKPHSAKKHAKTQNK